MRFVEPLPPGRLVMEGDRLLAGVGNNAWRAWVFPLCTPAGLNVLQEYAFDHPFHNGLFVAQGGIHHDGGEHNFWAVDADPRQPDNPVMKRLGRTAYPTAAEAAIDGLAARFAWRTTWIGADGRPVLDEERTVTVRPLAAATLVEVVSAKRAAHGPLRFAATKCGSIGLRAQPQLLPPLGGAVVAVDGDEVRHGAADAVVGARGCDAVGYERALPGGMRFGLCLLAPSDSSGDARGGPWFVRDYGLAVYAPTLKRAIDLAAGETWTCSLRVAAYDGELTGARLRSWLTA
jgi:hypothetical protein